METIKIRCRMCGKELENRSNKTVTCGCPNMATIIGDKILANDLSEILMLNSLNFKNRESKLSSEDISWQEKRRQRKVKKLDYEVR